MSGGGQKKIGGSSELYLSQLVNLAIPVGFVLARDALAKTKSANQQQQGGGVQSDIAARMQHVSFRIQQFLDKNKKL